MADPLLILVTGDPVASARVAHGGFADMIRQTTGQAWPGPWLAVDLRDGGELPRAHSLSGVIITGSAAHIGDPDPWISRGLEYLQGLVAAGTPTLGICFGHQMLGAALGGRVARNPYGREVGTVRLRQLTRNPLVSPLEPLTASATHLDSIVQLPNGASNFVRTDREEHALVQFADRVWGVQFHPEMGPDVVRCYIEERRAAIDAEGLSSETLLAELDAGAAGRSVLPNFVRNVVLGAP